MESNACGLAWMERTWGLDTWVLAGFSTLPPSQPGYPAIPLTNWHLINPNELFSNFIIHHQELMRERAVVGGGSLEQGLGGSERKGLESPAGGAGPGPDGRRG